jgi:hypothetical protein
LDGCFHVGFLVINCLHSVNVDGNRETNIPNCDAVRVL